MAAADTNVLVRLLMDDDEDQARAARAFQRSAPLFVSHVVLAELSWVLTSAYGFKRAELGKVLGMLLDTEGVAIERPSIVHQAVRHFDASAADFSDCLVLAIAQAAAAAPVGTFDKKFAKLPGARRLGKK